MTKEGPSKTGKLIPQATIGMNPFRSFMYDPYIDELFLPEEKQKDLIDILEEADLEIKKIYNRSKKNVKNNDPQKRVMNAQQFLKEGEHDIKYIASDDIIEDWFDDKNGRRDARRTVFFSAAQANGIDDFSGTELEKYFKKNRKRKKIA